MLIIEVMISESTATNKAGVQGILFGNYAWNSLPITELSLIKVR
jgi:hypothetical protein